MNDYNDEPPQNKVPLTFGSIISLKISTFPNLYLISQGFFVNNVFLDDFSCQDNHFKHQDFLLTTFKILPFPIISHFKTQILIKDTLIDNYDFFKTKSNKEILAKFYLYLKKLETFAKKLLLI